MDKLLKKNKKGKGSKKKSTRKKKKVCNLFSEITKTKASDENKETEETVISKVVITEKKIDTNVSSSEVRNKCWGEDKKLKLLNPVKEVKKKEGDTIKKVIAWGDQVAMTKNTEQLITNNYFPSIDDIDTDPKQKRIKTHPKKGKLTNYFRAPEKLENSPFGDAIAIDRSQVSPAKEGKEANTPEKKEPKAKSSPFGDAKPTENPFGNAKPTENGIGEIKPAENPFGGAKPIENPFGDATPVNKKPTVNTHEFVSGMTIKKKEGGSIAKLGEGRGEAKQKSNNVFGAFGGGSFEKANTNSRTIEFDENEGGLMKFTNSKVKKNNLLKTNKTVTKPVPKANGIQEPASQRKGRGMILPIKTRNSDGKGRSNFNFENTKPSNGFGGMGQRKGKGLML